MSGQRTVEEPGPAETTTGSLGAGLVGGLLAGVAMGVLFQFGTGVMGVLGGIVGTQSVVVGWVVHLTISALAGVAFAMIASYPIFEDLGASLWGSTLLGVVHATGLAFVLIGLVLPMLLATGTTGVVGAAFPFLPVPGTTGTSGAGGSGLVAAAAFGAAHFVYGIVLGVAYWYLRDAWDGE